MGSQTQNLGLYKPDRTDYVSVITDINNNMDTIDGRVTSLHTPELLWQNPNPDSPLDHVLNVSKSLNLYNAIDLFFKQSYNSSVHKAMRISLLTGQETPISCYLEDFSSISGSSAGLEYFQRNVLINPTGSVIFSAHATAVSISSTGVVFTQNDYYCIPYQIWGVDRKV